jgi:hypothetical protein
MGPFQVFLLANVVFVAAQSLTGMNVLFSSTLDSHLNHQDWSALAQRLVARRLDARHTTLDALAPAFNRSVAFLAKSLVIVMAIPFSLLCSALYVRQRRPLGVHAVFAVHVYAFVLLLSTVALVVAGVDVLLGGAGLDSARFDTIVSVLNLSAIFAYLFVATRTVFGTRGPWRILTSATLAIAVAVIAHAYRFGLFLLALYVA